MLSCPTGEFNQYDANTCMLFPSSFAGSRIAMNLLVALVQRGTAQMNSIPQYSGRLFILRL